MFGLSFWEIAIILGVALVFLGPSKLPELARTFGKSLREFRKATDEFRSTIQDEVYKEEPRAPQLAAQPQHAVPAPVAAQPVAQHAQPVPQPVTQPLAQPMTEAVLEGPRPAVGIVAHEPSVAHEASVMAEAPKTTT